MLQSLILTLTRLSTGVSKREIRPRESLTLNFIALQELLTVKTGEGMFHELVTPGQPWAEHREM